MQKQFYFLSPVEVVKVTKGNLEDVAKWCGGEIAETPSRRHQGVMDKYVLVPTSSDKKTSTAFPGNFVTRRLVIDQNNKLKETWAVFRRDYFEKNYFQTPAAASDATWERFYADSSDIVPATRTKPNEQHLTNNLGEAYLAKQRELEARLEKLEKEPDDPKDQAYGAKDVQEAIAAEALEGKSEAEVEAHLNGDSSMTETIDQVIKHGQG